VVTGSLELGEVLRVAAVAAGNPGLEDPDKRVTWLITGTAAGRF